jgi:hypothetical protein
MWASDPAHGSRVLSTVLVLLAAVLVAVPPVAAEDATVITFEEGISTPSNITTQYCISAATNKGVKFLEPVRLIEPAVGTMTPTHAATNHFIGDEFTESNVMQIGFTADQSFVSVRVGLDRNYNFPVTAYLRAYTSATPSPATQLTDGEDSVLLGQYATTINQQLYVTSGGSAQPIRSIEIEFGGPNPVNAAFEVIDNLLYPTPGPQCGSDTTPPVVQILKPVAGTDLYGSPAGDDVPLEVHFQATDTGSGLAVVDVDYLDAADAVVESFSVCGGANAPGCSLPATTVERNFLSQMPAATAKLRVTAQDFAGNSGQATRLVAITVSTVNLWARGLEITQATQPWVATNGASRRDGSLDPPTFVYPAVPQAVPLVKGRTTVVRLFVGVENTIGGDPLTGVGGVLHCFTEPSYTIACPGPSAVYPEHQPPNTTQTISVDPTHTLRDQREQSTRTLNFVLPDEWTELGLVHLEAGVAPPVPQCQGCLDSADFIRVGWITFREAPDWHSVVRQVLVDRGLGTATNAEREAAIDFIRRTYPVDESTIHNGFQNMLWLWLSVGGIGPDCSEFLDDLHSTFEYLLDDYGYKTIWALTDSMQPSWCAGLGRAQGVAVSRGDRWDSGAHEIGHTLGLLHTGPASQAHGAECQVAGYCDSDWPWPYGNIGDFGFDVLRFEVHDPGDPPTDNDDHDLMSYGDPVWISSRNWIRMFNALAGWSFPYPKATATSPAALTEEVPVPPAPHLLVRGRYDPATSQWELLPIYEVERIPTPPVAESPDLLVELVDGAGTVLATRPVDLPEGEHVDTDDPNVVGAPDPSFVRFVEIPAGTTRVVLRDGTSILASRARSDNAPTVGVETPTVAGYDGTIRWSWSDDDGDPLMAWIEYRNTPDGPWQPLSIDVDDDRLVVDPALLPGGPSGQAKVTVTDGFNTTVALSEFFAVADKPPTAEILGPSTGTVLEAGRRVVLRGNAADMEDEVVTGSGLAWSSQLDGGLGSGGDVEVAGLSAGTHLITLTAADSAGNEGSAAVIVYVLPAPSLNGQPTAHAGPDQVWSAAGTAQLDGSASYDPDADPLTYRWSVASAPPGADAQLDDPYAARPILQTAVSGTYEVELVVHDGEVGSRPDSVVVQRDLVAPEISVVAPTAGTAVQDGVGFAAAVVDEDSGVGAVWFTLREDDGAQGSAIGFEEIAAVYDPVTGAWIAGFDTTRVPDGYYLITASARDVAGNSATGEPVAFSVRNWALVELLPATPNHNAGRTVPVKFSINVDSAVDPATPFVHNEDLVISIYETDSPDVILQEATFGEEARAYRIDDHVGFYITNFKTLRAATEYTVSISRGDFVIGSFGFATVRGKP